MIKQLLKYSIKPRFRLNLIERYVLNEFIWTFILCVFAATSLFIVFEIFERMRTFLREDSTFSQAASYIILKIPMVIQLTLPIAALVATLISIGRLSQRSEITAMKAVGISVIQIARPLLYLGICLTFIMFAAGETIIPWATEEMEKLYHFEIRKKDQKGTLSRSNFWFRENNYFFRIDQYDSRTSTLSGLVRYKLDADFRLAEKLEAQNVTWGGRPLIGWTMNNVTEITVSYPNTFELTSYKRLPLVIEETPRDFYNMKQSPESLNYFALREFIEKLKLEGSSITKYLVDLYAKLSFPWVNFIAILVAIPFAITNSRTGKQAINFVLGLSVGFAYYIIHALCMSLGSAELLGALTAAWTANILFICIGGYLIASSD